MKHWVIGICELDLVRRNGWPGEQLTSGATLDEPRFAMSL